MALMLPLRRDASIIDLHTAQVEKSPDIDFQNCEKEEDFRFPRHNSILLQTAVDLPFLTISSKRASVRLTKSLHCKMI